jgi:thymidine kinase
MGVLRFSFGTMGSGKSTLALQIHHNLQSCGLAGFMCTQFDRDGAQVTSRLGVSSPALEVGADTDVFEVAERFKAREGLAYVVADEAQFYTSDQVDQLARVVDDLGADVFAFGLLTDFRGLLFDGSRRLLEVADEKVPLQVEARCWCGARATHNARLVNGRIVYEGDVVVVGDTDPDTSQRLFGDTTTYELLCRRHYRSGSTARS